MSFSEWLKVTRLSTGRSQEKVAREARLAGCALSQSRISEFERDITLPSFPQLVAMMRALELDDASRIRGRALWDEAQLQGTSRSAA